MKLHWVIYFVSFCDGDRDWLLLTLSIPQAFWTLIWFLFFLLDKGRPLKPIASEAPLHLTLSSSDAYLMLLHPDLPAARPSSLSGFSLLILLVPALLCGAFTPHPCCAFSFCFVAMGITPSCWILSTDWLGTLNTQCCTSFPLLLFSGVILYYDYSVLLSWERRGWCMQCPPTHTFLHFKMDIITCTIFPLSLEIRTFSPCKLESNFQHDFLCGMAKGEIPYYQWISIWIFSVYLRLSIQIFPYTKDTESKEFRVLMIYVKLLY